MKKFFSIIRQKVSHRGDRVAPKFK